MGVAMTVGHGVEGLHSLLQCAAAGVASPLVHAAVKEVETNLLSENTQRQSVRYKSIFCQLRRRIAASNWAKVMTKARATQKK